MLSRAAFLGVVTLPAILAVGSLVIWNGDNDYSHLSRFLLKEEIDSVATFLGVPVTYQPNPPPYSTTHCIGENFDAESSNAWLYRSCHFRNICWDSHRQDLVLFPSPREQQLLTAQQSTGGAVTLSSVANSNKPFSLAAVEVDDSTDEQDAQQLFSNRSWFPLTVNERPASFYQLPDTHILVPFTESYPLSHDSVRNKDFRSIFTLLYTFGLENKNMMLLRHSAEKDNQKCDQDCQTLIRAHLSSMGVRQDSVVVVEDNTSSSSLTQSNFVCAKYAAAGLGMLMTGFSPVWKNGAWTNTNTIGRETTLRDFEEFIKRNIATAEL